MGAYRDNKVSSSHPLVLTLEGRAKKGVSPEVAQVGNLSEQELTAALRIYIPYPNKRCCRSALPGSPQDPRKPLIRRAVLEGDAWGSSPAGNAHAGLERLLRDWSCPVS